MYPLGGREIGTSLMNGWSGESNGCLEISGGSIIGGGKSCPGGSGCRGGGIIGTPMGGRGCRKKS